MEHASADFSLGRPMRLMPQQTSGDEGDDAEKLSMTSTRWATGNSTTHAATTVSSNVNIIQLNLQHNKAATAVLRQQLEKLDNAVALIQEPWVRGNSILGLNIKNGTTYRGSVDEHSRTCIVVKGLPAYNLPQLGSKDITVVCITYCYKTVTTCFYIL